jgi:ornithine--oxo-acid transaminase
MSSARRTADFLAADADVCAQNYAPLPIVATRAAGCHIWDVEDRCYLDMMSGYSAVGFGHSHPRLVQALTEQAGRLAMTSRAMHSDQLAPFLAKLTETVGLPRALPMNTGAEAVETAIKAARKWATVVKGVPDGSAEIIVCANNFHGRTTTLVGFSSHDNYRYGFGGFAPGFVTVPFGDAQALRAAITPRTAAFLFEPIQGEGGINVPPPGFLRTVRAICSEHKVLMIADEVQTGLGRTGRVLACDHEDVRPDGVCLGKALGGGLLPVSAFVATEELMGVFTPGDHGSTFGGMPLAARVGLEALCLLAEEKLAQRAAQAGEYLKHRLMTTAHPLVREVRGKGLLIGVELESAVDAHAIAEAMARRGVITKDTHRNTIRFSPPLVVHAKDLDQACDALFAVLDEAWSGRSTRTAAAARQAA